MAMLVETLHRRQTPAVMPEPARGHIGLHRAGFAATLTP